MTGAERSFVIVVMLFVLGFLGLGAFHYHYQWTVIRFPVGVGLVVCLMCVANMVMARGPPKARAGAGGPAENTSAEKPAGFGRDLPAIMWVAAMAPVVFSLGYVIGLPLYVFVYLKTHGQGWIMSGALSVSILALVYLGFVKALGVHLPVLPVGFS